MDNDTDPDFQPPMHILKSMSEAKTNTKIAKAETISARRNKACSCSERLDNTPDDPLDDVMKPLTDEERRAWKGWAEIESDPGLFNFILREYGIKDVKVQEVLSLDEDMLNLLPKPVYGMIYLCEYREDEWEDGKSVETCPNYVWFANQTINNACATIALLNICMNVPEIDLGNAIQTFKEATLPLKPAYRGQRLGCDDFIRMVHNSFARRMDILSADLALSNEAAKWREEQNNRKRKGAKRKKKKAKEDLAFHFIAFVPIQGDVWRLDGLQRQPVKLGGCGDDWMVVARASIQEHINRSNAEGLNFNLLSLCKSPLVTIPLQLAQGLRSIIAIEDVLTHVSPDWRLFIESCEPKPLCEPNEAFGLTQDIIDNSQLSNQAIDLLRDAGTDIGMLMELHRNLTVEQIALQRSYIEEVSLVGQENEQAARRKHDHTPMIYKSVKLLAEQGVLKGISKMV
ncbi:hypothetical protein B7494_g7083 [Chlorociboria aeruginascens]|nr:hypothetical protein B7494_g7083 [Chlorociboria aeruginascens]